MDSSQLFLGNIDPSTSADVLEPILYEFLSQCGIVKAIRIPTSSEGANTTRGFAFAEMSNPKAATYAVLALNGMKLLGRTIRVACAMEDESKKLIKLENIPHNIDEIDLYNALSDRFNLIRGISIRRNRDGKSEGKATVWFETTEQASNAKDYLNTHPMYFDNILIRVT